MESKLSIGGLQARRDAKVNKLASFGPTLQGTLTNVGVTCGNPNCRCARGHKHRSFRVTKKVAGKTKSLYVPVDMLEEVQEWIKQHRQLKKLLQEISDLNEKIIRAYVSTKRAKKANRDNATKGAGYNASRPNAQK